MYGEQQLETTALLVERYVVAIAMSISMAYCVADSCKCLDLHNLMLVLPMAFHLLKSLLNLMVN